MKHLSTLKSLLLVLFAVLGGVNVAGADMFVIDFENDATTYSDWTFNNMTSQQTGSITAHGGINYGTTGGKATASITTKEPISNPVSITFYVSKQSSNTTSSSWKIQVSSNNSTWEDVMTQSATSMTKGSWVEVTQDLTSYNDVYIRVYYTGSTAIRNIDDVSLVYEASDPNKPAAPTFSLAEGTYWSVQSLVLSTTVEGGGICYTIDGTDPTKSETSMVYSTAISLSTTTTVNACVVDADGNFSNVVSRTYTFVPSIANKKETAYTTAEAIAIIDSDSHPAEQLAAEAVYVKGTVSKVDSYNSKYKSITYWLDNNAFKVYSGKGLHNADFSAKTDIEVGAQVIVCGNLTKYNTTYELDQNNCLVEYTAPAAKAIKSVEITGAASKTTYEKGEKFSRNGLTLTVTYEDETIQDVTSDATWTVTPETLNEIGTAQVTVTATYKEYNPSKSIEVTVTAPQPAALPFSFDDGKSAISTTQGMDQTGLGNDYASTPKLKFDGAGDELVIYYDGPASYLGYTIKGNGFSGGTFSVMESVDGANYTNVATYTELTQVNTACMNALKSASRYVKFVYTEKSSGNVALGAIEISADKTPITISAAGYATYYNSAKACTLPAGCKGYVFYKGKLQNMYNGLDPVPANEPLVIKAVEDTHVLNFTTTGQKSLKSKGLNDLEGTDEETALPTDDNYYFYALSLNSAGELNSVGFYWMNEDGVAFTNGAHKAYLKLAKNKVAGIKAFVFGDEETAIESVEAETANEEIFDLSGRKVSKAVKGLYIINGKKVVK